MVSNVVSVIATIICLADEIWYVFFLGPDHVEKEHQTSVVFLGVNLILSGGFLVIIKRYNECFNDKSTTKYEPLNAVDAS